VHFFLNLLFLSTTLAHGQLSENEALRRGRLPYGHQGGGKSPNLNRLVQTRCFFYGRQGRARVPRLRRRRRLGGDDHDADARTPRCRRACAVGRSPPTSRGRIYDEERKEIRTTMEPTSGIPQRAGRVDLILERARDRQKPGRPFLEMGQRDAERTPVT